MLWLVLALASLLAVVLVSFNLHRWRTRVAVQGVPPSVIREALQLIDSAGAQDGSRVVLLRPVPDSLPDGLSRLTSTSAPSRDRKILAQVALTSPPLPQAWQGRILSLYAAGEEIHASCATNRPEEPAGNVNLEAVRLPLPASGPEAESSPWSPHFLCERVPQLRPLLAPYCASVERLLPYLLVPGIDTFEIDTHHLTLMGGQPELIQGEHEAKCSTCANPMRFLLSSGALGDTLHGDAPVAYVYGCDVHPDNVRAFVDIH
jgi:hypothetical protein